MPKTRELKLGKKTYTLRDQISGQIVDWYMLQTKRLAKLDQDGDLAHAEQMRIQNELIMKMVVSPHITAEFFEGDEYTIDDVKLGIVLTKELTEAFNEVMEEKQIEVKKK